ncbi:MAG: hypothetical protein M5R36_05830 [Deltaproteobacteria bacterium]|nr:hypothetical protein [Deltaproteobacteria bacterium]
MRQATHGRMGVRDHGALYAAVIVAAVFIFHVATNLSFLHAEKRPANINELSHVIAPIDFLNLLVDQPDPHVAYMVAFSGYPPAGAVATVFYALLGRAHESAQISQLLFSLLAIACLYALGAAAFRPRHRHAGRGVFSCFRPPCAK